MTIDKLPGKRARPRNKTAGMQLRQALKLLDKHWRKNACDPGHVLNWEAWQACGLPRSATTIDYDMRIGVPEDRMMAYAYCLGLPPRAFGDPDADIHFLIGMSQQNATRASSIDLGFGAAFSGEYNSHNTPEYIHKLFGLMEGVYRAFYVLHGVEPLGRCAYWINQAAPYFVKSRGFFIMFDMENVFEANTFRWHNNLHTFLLCDNRTELAHYMTIDPLRHNLVARRSPLWLKGHGITDRGLAENAPISYILRKQKLHQPEGVSLEELWRQECCSLRSRPAVMPDDDDYEELRAQILEPDTLL
jgi:hypothetical protein